MKVAAIQHDIVWEDPTATCAHVAPMIAEAADADARLVVLTEMFASGFSLDAARVAEPEGGETATFLAERAAEHGCWVAASIPTQGGGARPVNRMHICGPAGELHLYDKVHPFSYAGEDEHYDAGSQLVTFDIEGLRVSPLICYDLRFADAFWELAADTDCYLVVANWPESRRHHWNALLSARAIENQAYVVGVNRVGVGDGLAYSGDSRILNPQGRVLAGHEYAETILYGDVDPEVVAETRNTFRFMPDRRS